MARHHVHLSSDRESAELVGSRWGKPIILRVDAKLLAALGKEFWVTGKGVWLTNAVPADALDHARCPLWVVGGPYARHR